MSNKPDQNGMQKPISQGDSAQNTIQEILQKVNLTPEQAITLLQQTEIAYGRLIPRQLLTLLDRNSIIDVKLGDQIERKLTIMFSDIRNFTPLSESMTPSENFEFINSYLSQMEPVIGKHHGIIDKYMGDTIMALYTQSADDAVRGSIAILEKLQHYNAGRARAGYVPIAVGIGLNSGMVIIGTVGGANRMDSTVIGDAVNLASRIEEATKTYHVPLLLSQNTLYDLADTTKYDIRFLDRIRVKGKSQPLSIYEVFDNDPADLREGKRASKEMFERAIAYYHLKKIPQAMELLAQCIQIAPYDVPAHIYLSRCEEFVAKGKHLTTGELNVRMEWQREFNIGIVEIDKSHESLFDNINDFIVKIQQGDQSGISDILSFLDHHAKTYFKVEEEMMEFNKYLFFESHLQEHKRFVENIMALAQEAEAGTSDPHFLSFRTQLLVFDWFTGHIAKTDRHMGRHLLGSTRPVSDKA